MCRRPPAATRCRFDSVWSINASMRTVPMASKKLPVRTLVSDVRRLPLLRPLVIVPGPAPPPAMCDCPGPGTDGGSAAPWVSDDARVDATDGIVPWLEKLRMVGMGMRGAVLLRLRLWLEKRGTVGGSAASSIAGSISGTGSGWLRDRLPFGVGRGRPFAMRIESRIGLRRRAAVGAAGEVYSSCGTGGSASRSWMPEWLRKESAVSQT